MDADKYCSIHTCFYFVVMAIGGALIRIGFIHPIYNTETGEILTPYTLFFILIGIMFIFLAFIGLRYFSEIREDEE